MYTFGKQEKIHSLASTTLKGPNDESLYIGYKTTSYHFLAGIYLHDDGYVLGIKGNENNAYLDLTPRQIKELQTQHLLPQTLPAYKIPFADYLFGYSFWIILGLMIVYGVLKEGMQNGWFNRRKGFAHLEG